MTSKSSRKRSASQASLNSQDRSHASSSQYSGLSDDHSFRSVSPLLPFGTIFRSNGPPVVPADAPMKDGIPVRSDDPNGVRVDEMVVSRHDEEAVRHFRVPTSTNLARSIGDQPIVAAVRWRTKYETLTVQPLTNKWKYQAMIAQTRGELQNLPCSQCKKEIGPFAECRVALDKKGRGPLKNSCANCIWDGKGNCSLRADSTEKSTRLAAEVSSATAQNPQTAPHPSGDSSSHPVPNNYELSVKIEAALMAIEHLKTILVDLQRQINRSTPTPDESSSDI